MKVALVHDDFIQQGGAENLFATIASLYPDAPIYTSLVDWHKLPSTIDRSRIRPSFIQKFAIAKKWYKIFLPLYPVAFESFNLDNYDLIITSTTRFAKAIITKPTTIHVCYINSVPRFLWNEKIQPEYLPELVRILVKPFLKWFKRWDKVAASRVDFYCANSQNIANQVKTYYGRQADVVYPFADLDFFKPAKIHKWQLKSQNYFLTVGRLVKWKKLDIAIEAAKNLKVNLKIVGTGPDKRRLKRLTTGNQIEFVGQVTKEALRDLYQNCQALIVTQEEDFGIAAVEAQACGVPVVAYQKGGMREIIIDGQTGLFFTKQSATSLEDAINRLLKIKWRVLVARQNAQRFSRAIFIKALKLQVKNYAKGSSRS